jgi:hypothetical protein
MPDLPRVSHYGTIHIGDLAFDGVVLEDGTRGYVQRQLLQAVGFHVKNQSNRISRFLADLAPNALNLLNNSGSPRVRMPSGGHANFLPAGVLSEIASGVIDAALGGNLHHKQQAMVKPCMAIMRALAKTGEVALIDEATGYQYERAPNALQDLFGRLIREHCSDWERRFHPDYYASLFRLFGWKYEGQSQRPVIIGQITDQLVYGAVFPTEIMAEVRERRGGRLEKLHQWLKDGGLRLLENQISAVRMMADSSTDYADFKNRCMVTFRIPGQIGFVFPSPEASQ